MSTDSGVLATLRATPTPVRYLLGGVLINQLGAFVQTFILLYLTFRGDALGIAGLSLAAYSVGSIFGTLLGGELTHRFGPRTTITMAMLASAPLVASIPFVATIPVVLFLVVGLAGLVTQTYRPAAAVLLSDLMPEEHQVMAFSMMRIALNTGAAVAPLIAAGLILIDWDLLFYLDGATALLYGLLAYLLLPRVEAPKDDEEKKPAVDARAAYARMAGDRKYLAYLAAVFLGTIAYAQSVTALPLEIVADKYPTSLYSAVLTVSSLVLITCELKITSYIVKIPQHIAVFAGHMVNSLGFVLYALAFQSGTFVILGAVFAVSGLMIAGPTMFAHPAKFPAEYKSRYIGTMQAVIGLASAIGPLFGVFTFNSLGGAFWIVIALVNGVAGLLAVYGVREAQKEPVEAGAA
ncbi:MFS transporter [Lentzea aerocolonigenes]|uniref:MFS transporter n=1 Tax=Lentzea aerocolonigenes TaxID=68170 RepID=A0A0F0GY61_LENAE|nr:MFS transporter [Lentzea aerocolonigenes]KJK48235.1 MFS transporter [Lentzea aerocolonigenes]